MMFLAFLARTEPADSMAKPACMKKTCTGVVVKDVQDRDARPAVTPSGGQACRAVQCRAMQCNVPGTPTAACMLPRGGGRGSRVKQQSEAVGAGRQVAAAGAAAGGGGIVVHHCCARR